MRSFVRDSEQVLKLKKFFGVGWIYMWYIGITKNKLLGLCFFFAIIWSMAQMYAEESVPVFAMPVSRRVVLIDAGHGARDPGKVAGNILEKEINLAISLKLQSYLEAGGATVLMTRVDDEALSASKTGDMNQRRQIANASHADIFVSIHQNSFTNENVHGAQVFYFDTSDNSRKLAEHIQRNLRDFADPSNRLEAKPNENYYVLRQTRMPAVIVECGFLTNSNERHRLTQEEYQERIAWSIYSGIVDYFNDDSVS